MDAERLTFLFGDAVLEGAHDLDDPDVRARLLHPTFAPDAATSDLIMREAIATQLYSDNPPEVWTTVQRLLKDGIDRERIFEDIGTVLDPLLHAAVNFERPYDRADYISRLASLPLPTDDEVEAALLDAVRRHDAYDRDDIIDRTLQHLNRHPYDEVVMDLAQQMFDEMLRDDGAVVEVDTSRFVVATDVTDGVVFTHRLAAWEVEEELVDLTFDLAPLRRWGDLRLEDGAEVHIGIAGDDEWCWKGSDGWLDGHVPGDLIGVSATRDHILRLVDVAADPPADPALVAKVRAAYDRVIAEDELPVDARNLAIIVLADDPGAFGAAAPSAPLSELAAAAGLERRGDLVAHDEVVWHRHHRHGVTRRLFRSMRGATGGVFTVLRALDLADRLAGIEMPPPHLTDQTPDDASELAALLDDLQDGPVVAQIGTELAAQNGPLDERARRAFVSAALEVAETAHQRAIAHYLAARVAEVDGEPDVAEQHLHVAHEADRDLTVATDRLAWCASDRGDASTALRLWRSIGTREADTQAEVLAEVAGPPTPRQLGRNEPCWCGSGRKFKQCHLGATELAPLPDRVAWLWFKACSFLERRVGSDALLPFVEACCVDPDDEEAWDAAVADPLPSDLALVEAGWSERFLAERGSLLPDDEALLAASWTLVERSVHEVIGVQRGNGVDLRDLRTGDHIAVRDRLFSSQARQGMLICACVVPDGETHQLIGSVVAVRPGRESDLLEVLDRGDAEEIGEWFADASAPPRLHTREDEVMVECTATVDTGDARSAKEFLDATYEVEDSIWHEFFEIAEGERIVRATLRLDGPRVDIETRSVERIDRVVAMLRTRFPDARVVAEERRPFDVRILPEVVGSQDPADLLPDDPAVVELLEQIRDRHEVRWCDESVPALGGLTPRQAAEDPTRRDALIRLIDSFPGQDLPGAMRASRVRELLDL